MGACDHCPRQSVAIAQGRGAARLSVMPAAGGVAAGVPRRASRLVERAGAGVRRSRCVAGDHRARAGQARRQPHRTAVHRRLCGDLLYATLAKFQLSEGSYGADRDDGLRLKGAIILNAVKCLPPQNKTLPIEEANCRPFLMEGITSLPRLTTFIALGKVAHDSLCRSFGVPLARPNSPTVRCTICLAG